MSDEEEQERPQVAITMSDWCPWHLEPFRDDWPGSYARACIPFVRELFASEELIALCPKDEDGKAKTASVDAVKSELKPTCCFLGEEAMGRVYTEAGVPPPEQLDAYRSAVAHRLKGRAFPEES